MHEKHNVCLSTRTMSPSDRYLMDEVLQGLSETPKRLSPIWFYDERGSQLFDQICELPEYYPTRTELAILRERIDEIADAVGSGVCVIEPGSGTSLKTRLLLERLHDVVAYVPVDIAGEHLIEAATQLRADYPHIEVNPVCADFTKGFHAEVRRHVERNLVFFPGSTIGNFEPAEAIRLLRQMGELAGAHGAILIGVDLRKDPAILVPAYDDSRGITAEFNRNALLNLNRTLGAQFVPERFKHRAVWNADESRIEMHLVSCCRQTVRIGEELVLFEAGEVLVTEYSHKYTLEAFSRQAREAGLEVETVWVDGDKKFSVQLLRLRS